MFIRINQTIEFTPQQAFQSLIDHLRVEDKTKVIDNSLVWCVESNIKASFYMLVKEFWNIVEQAMVTCLSDYKLLNKFPAIYKTQPTPLNCFFIVIKYFFAFTEGGGILCRLRDYTKRARGPSSVRGQKQNAAT